MTGMRVFSGWGVSSLDRPSNLDRMARRLFHGVISRFRWGRLHLVEGSKRLTVGRRSNVCPIEATIFVKNPRFYRHVLLAGSVGAGESFALGNWSADKLTDALRIILLNWSMFEQMHREWQRLSTPAFRLLHLTRQTIDNSQKQVASNFGVTGDDISVVLPDENLSHTCGIFSRPNTTLTEAVSAAHERLCRKLRLRADDAVLEIGSAWGGFARHAAKRYGCHVVAAVESDTQIQTSRQRVKADGVGDRVRIVQKDFRQLEDRYDKLISIETISSMARRNQESFFLVCNRLLKDDGVMAFQTVIRTDNSCRQLSAGVNLTGPFVQSNGCLPSLTSISQSVDKHTDLRLVHLEDLTPHYAVTMRRWRERLYANVDRARDLGISERDLKRWAFHLCYGEAGFAERHFGCVQLIFAKSLSRHLPILPPLASKFGVILQKRKNEIENWL